MNEDRWQAIWYGQGRVPLWALSLSLVYRLVTACRRFAYRLRLLRRIRVTPIVIVVGNITVGGAGKTPLVIWLVEMLQRNGYSCGIVSRGYGSQAGKGPVTVSARSTAREVGDEPLLMARRLNVPVVVGSDRVACARSLQAAGVDIIISDDGLQHYRLMRNIEIAVVDGQRILGNGRMLPAGPLREPSARLQGCDHVVHNGGEHGELIMHLRADGMNQVKQPTVQKEIAELVLKQPVAIAGIGNPQRFFDSIETMGIECETQPFPDHHPFSRDDFDRFDDRSVIMTEKDAVKCAGFAGDDWWYVRVDAELPDEFSGALLARIKLLTPDSDND